MKLIFKTLGRKLCKKTKSSNEKFSCNARCSFQNHLFFCKHNYVITVLPSNFLNKVVSRLCICRSGRETQQYERSVHCKVVTFDPLFQRLIFQNGQFFGSPFFRWSIFWPIMAQQKCYWIFAIESENSILLFRFHC